MTEMAKRSSAIAIVSRKSFTPAVIRSPRRASTPIANAIVGRHGDRPTVGLLPAGGEREEDRGRQQHPAESGQHRKKGDPRLAQLPRHQLALDLEAHDEEEEGHQTVIDPVLKILGDGQRAAAIVSS